MTHRQFVTWHSWLSEELNNPNRSDWCILRVAQEIVNFRNGFVGLPAVSLEEMKIVFESPDEVKKAKESEEERQYQANRIAASKSRWFGLSGYSSKRKT